MPRVMGGHQPHVFPGIEYLARMSACDVWVFSDDVKFNRHDWQNRNRIKAPGGFQMITIPVTGKDDDKLFEKRSTGSKWNEKLWRTLEMTYGKSPFWDDLTWLRGVLLTPGLLITSYARQMLVRFTEYLQIQTKTVWATQLGLPFFESSSEKIAEQAKLLECEIYATGSQGWTYLDPAPFKDLGVEVRGFLWQCPEYPQRWMADGFVANLSVVDLIANVGPEAAKLIRTGIVVGESKWGEI